MEERNSEVAPQGTNEAPNTFVFPPEGVVLKEEEMEEFELLKESHHLRPKDPSLAPAQFQSKPIVIECKICSKHFWSLQLTIDHVKNDDKHKKRYKARESEKKLREVSSIALTPEHIESLTRFVEQSYCENAAAVNEPVGLRSSVASEFKDFIGVELPDVSVEFFGSSVSELALKGSDVNINLDYEEKDEEIIYPRIPEVLRTAHKVLEAQSAIYGQIETDFYAYIPCIRCIHIKSNLKMNIRAGHHSSAVALSRLLGVYSKIDRRFQTLAVVFLCWAKRCELNDQESGYYCSSMFHTMVLYFLQQREKPILPVLHELSCSSEEEGLPPTSEESATLDRQYLDELPLLEEKWECRNSEPLGLLWFELLRLYTVQLKFPEVVVCVRQSAVMQRNKDWPGNRLAIEHPFMKKYDLGKAVASQPAQDYLKSCLREALVYFGHLDLPLVKSPKGGQRPPKQEEAMVVQNLEECSTKADQEAVDSVTGGTDTSHLAQSMKGKMDVFLSLSFIESTPSKKKRPVACYKCKQDGHIAKRCTNDCTKDLIDFGDVCSVSEEMREAIQGLMESYLDQRGLNEFGYKLRRRLRDEILADILLVYPTAKLEIFGSSGNGFGTLDSDLDLCMMLEGVTTPEEKAKVIEVLFGMMKNNPGRKYNKLIPITNARVPIIKFIYRCKEMKHVECDISLGNYLAVHNTKMLGAYSRIDHRVRVLGHTLKCLMKNCGVADASQGSLSSYAYILMVVHYLQRTSPPVLPVLQKLYPPGSDTKERLVGKWNCYFYDFQDPSELASLWPGLGKNKENVVNLFVGMLRYYSVDFDWKHKVVSIRLEPECILDKFDKMWIGKVACVEDPFDLSHNLGTVVSQRMFKFVHSVLMNTAGYLLGKGKCSKPLTLDTLGRTRNLVCCMPRACNFCCDLHKTLLPRFHIRYN
jgi:terminal uridylyltransferase